MEKENSLETLDYLPNTEIYLYQRKDMFRFNTDTHLLGNFMHLTESDSVLDIGTNNGALLLYASLQTKGPLYGVEIQEEACFLAKKNLDYNKIDNYQLFHQDVKTLELDPVDVIICNPPYFKLVDQGNINKNKAIQIARHEIELDLLSLVQSMQRLVKEGGRIYLVHRAIRCVDILTLLREHQLEPKRIQFIYDEAYEEAKGILVEAVKGGSSYCVVERPHYVKR